MSGSSRQGLGRCPISMVRSGGIKSNWLERISNLSVCLHPHLLHFDGSNLALIEYSMLVITEPNIPSIQVQVNVL